MDTGATVPVSQHADANESVHLQQVLLYATHIIVVTATPLSTRTACAHGMSPSLQAHAAVTDKTWCKLHNAALHNALAKMLCIAGLAETCCVLNSVVPFKAYQHEHVEAADS